MHVVTFSLDTVTLTSCFCFISSLLVRTLVNYSNKVVRVGGIVVNNLLLATTTQLERTTERLGTDGCLCPICGLIPFNKITLKICTEIWPKLDKEYKQLIYISVLLNFMSLLFCIVTSFISISPSLPRNFFPLIIMLY